MESVIVACLAFAARGDPHRKEEQLRRGYNLGPIQVCIARRFHFPRCSGVWPQEKKRVST